MKKTLVLLALFLLLATPALSQETRIYPARTRLPFMDISGGNITFLDANRCISWNRGDVTLCNNAADTLTLAGGQFVVPYGSAAAPSITFKDNTASGIYDVYGQQDIYFSVGGTLAAQIGSDKIKLGATNQVVIAKEGTGITQFGDDAATPVAQTLKGADGSGANIYGGDIYLAPGRPTGTGQPGEVYIQTAYKSATSSSTQSTLKTHVKFGSVHAMFDPTGMGYTLASGPVIIASGVYASHYSVASALFANLPGSGLGNTAGANNYFSMRLFCGNCVIADPCAAGGAGAEAVRYHDRWVCK